MIDVWNDPGDIDEWEYDLISEFLRWASDQFCDEYGDYLNGLSGAVKTCMDAPDDYKECVLKTARSEVKRVFANCTLKKHEIQYYTKEEYELVWQ